MTHMFVSKKMYKNEFISCLKLILISVEDLNVSPFHHFKIILNLIQVVRAELKIYYKKYNNLSQNIGCILTPRVTLIIPHFTFSCVSYLMGGVNHSEVKL